MELDKRKYAGRLHTERELDTEHLPVHNSKFPLQLMDMTAKKLPEGMFLASGNKVGWYDKYNDNILTDLLAALEQSKDESFHSICDKQSTDGAGDLAATLVVDGFAATYCYIKSIYVSAVNDSSVGYINFNTETAAHPVAQVVLGYTGIDGWLGTNVNINCGYAINIFDKGLTMEVVNAEINSDVYYSIMYKYVTNVNGLTGAITGMQ